ncbi:MULTISPECIES: hypothetical protein [Pseudomonas]|uniref:Lipoprotein n=1 Tax=Pseudomonas donghuensis TaxID=1163398 RepID=A0AAP0SFB7_9PSED|nr:MULTISPECIES: hypothetical protein [Pseudomonas]MDF9891218.1 hypothetical protein [Pseudomonas vranovensis]KDN99365.1 hypothetical protein BV82_2575 [Pseudomonas donghuensis]MBF4206255.1 hypothetical protein [Pseudomonas donghuensis]MBS7598907.1 hypothetical protein [Pseudomonas sp. RC2C2]MCP3750077.1 hypothetical protein [Pseudomonas sp. SBB6]
MSSLIRAAVLGLALAGLAGCTSKPVLTPQEQLVVGHNYNHEQVQQAILKAVANRGWTPRKVTPNLIQADILVRNTFYAAVDIHYSVSNFRINYRDSRELGYKDGKIHRNYNRWVNNLDKSILQELNKLEAQNIVQRAISEQHSNTVE